MLIFSRKYVNFEKKYYNLCVRHRWEYIYVEFKCYLHYIKTDMTGNIIIVVYVD